MTRVLVLYASTHGHTGKIAGRIAKAIGPAAELRSIDAAPDLAPFNYDAVIVGASVHAGHHQKAVRTWLHEHAAALNRMPSRIVESFAGALQYREYDFFTRLLIKLMMKHGGHPTDTSHDHDFTDWDAVERFGRECAELVAVPAS